MYLKFLNNEFFSYWNHHLASYNRRRNRIGALLKMLALQQKGNLRTQNPIYILLNNPL